MKHLKSQSLTEHRRTVRSFYGCALVILFLSGVARAQDHHQNLQAQANEAGKAFVAEDYGRLVDLTYPKLVELIGGREKMIAMIKGEVAQWHKQGFSVLSQSAEAPTQTFKVGNELYAVLPVVLKMKVPDGTLVGKSTMIAVSEDSGEHWTFADATNADSRMLKTLFPAAADKLQLPVAQKPVLYPEKEP